MDSSIIYISIINGSQRKLAPNQFPFLLSVRFVLPKVLNKINNTNPLTSSVNEIFVYKLEIRGHAVLSDGNRLSALKCLKAIAIYFPPSIAY